MCVYVVEHVLDIYTGLALEQALFHSNTNSSSNSSTSSNTNSSSNPQQHHPQQIIKPSILFWQSKPAVVIGRNQNPWLECNFSIMNKHQVQLARRDSGGGTVYHDEQNANICIISASQHDQVQRNLSCFQKLLSGLGVEVESNEKHDLLLDGKKVSGSAMRYTKNMLLHHFTLLLSPDTKHLQSMLSSRAQSTIQSTLQSSAVLSRRSEVDATGLRYQEIVSRFIKELPDMSAMLSIQDFHATGREEAQVHSIPNCDAFVAERTWKELFYEERQRLMSEQWLYGRTPSFSLEIKRDSDQKTYRIECSRGCLDKIVLDDTVVFSSPKEEGEGGEEGSEGGEEIRISNDSLRAFLKRNKDAILEEVVQKLRETIYGEN